MACVMVPGLLDELLVGKNDLLQLRAADYFHLHLNPTQRSGKACLHNTHTHTLACHCSLLQESLQFKIASQVVVVVRASYPFLNQLPSGRT